LKLDEENQALKEEVLSKGETNPVELTKLNAEKHQLAHQVKQT
jgi:hypothetical protein